MSPTQSDTTQKLKLWKEVLDYLDRLCMFASTACPALREWRRICADFSIHNDRAAKYKRRYDRGDRHDKHGTLIKNLLVFWCQPHNQFWKANGPARKGQEELQAFLNVVAEQIADDLRELKTEAVYGDAQAVEAFEAWLKKHQEIRRDI